jgi:hypothetical protein
MTWIDRRAGWLVAALVVLSAGVRFAFAVDAELPWIAPDEFLYALAGESLWDQGTLSVRGLEAPYTSLLTPAIVGAPLALFDVDAGIVAAQALQSLVMATAAIPVFLWARQLAAPRWALAAAALTLLVPGMAYGGMLMTEAAFYPLTLAALLAGARLLDEPTVLRQGLFLAFVTAACAVRMQALLLVPVLVVAVVLHAAVTRSRRTIRALAPIGAAALAVAILVAAATALTGSASLGERLLGAYQPVLETSASLTGVLGSIAAHGIGLALLCVVLPLVGTVVLVVEIGRGREQGAAAAYAAIATAFLGLLVLQVGAFAAQNVGYLSQRYLLTAAPVLFVGFAAWLERGAPRPRLVVALTAGLVVVGAVLVPIGDVVPNTGVQDALWTTWLRDLAIDSSQAARLVLVAVAAAVLLVLLVPRAVRPWATVGVVAVALLALSVDATRTVISESEAQQEAMIGSEAPAWLPALGGPAVLLATGEHPSRAIARTFFWNPGIASVVRFEEADVNVPPSPPVVRVDDDGLLRAPDGSVLAAPYLLSPSTVSVAGELVAQRLDPVAQTPGWRLWRAEQPPRITTRVVGALPNGDFAPELTAYVPGCKSGALEITFLGKSGDPIGVTVDGIPWGTIEVPSETAASARIPSPPYADGGHTCVFDFATEGYVGTTRIAFVPDGD